jgi:hypothetical protein
MNIGQLFTEYNIIIYENDSIQYNYFYKYIYRNNLIFIKLQLLNNFYSYL